jgi:photosystem II stability/assembly factor-like uncharacterized protein
MALVLTAMPARAQSWVPIGAPGGSVRVLAEDPSHPQRIYLGTADGILYRSEDGGRRWHRLAPGFPLRGYSLDEIVVDADGVVFVGYWEVQGRGGGVARSTDAGQTFTLLKGIRGQSVRALAMAPSNPKMIAAGTLAGVFLSRDGGEAWTRITPKGHPDLRNVESLAFDPNDPRILYAGTWHLAWKTLNGGAAWLPVHGGMIDDSDVMTLTVDRSHPQVLYATACSGIYRSSEGARRWTKLSGIPYSSRRTRAFAQAEDVNLLLAGTTEGLWISEDAGGTWSLMTPKDLVINSVIVQPSGTILLGTEGAGVLRSSDRGRTWVSSNTGFSERFVSRLLFDPSGQRLVVAVWGASRYGGVFVSPGVRGPWERPGDGLEGRRVLSLALMGTTILAGTDDGIYALPREARAWTRLPTRVDGRELHPRVTELIALKSPRILAATSNGVIHSLDGGRSWTRPAIGDDSEAYGLAVCPEDLKCVVAATESGFYRSRDAGETWKKVSSPLRGVTPHALTFLPSNERVLLATTTGGLFRSGDQGASWRRVNGGVPHSDLTGIAVSPDGRTIYASDFTRGGIFRSVDGGSTWDRMPADGLGSERVWTLAVDPTAPDRLLAAASAGGLHLLVPTSVATRNGARPLLR